MLNNQHLTSSDLDKVRTNELTKQDDIICLEPFEQQNVLDLQSSTTKRKFDQIEDIPEFFLSSDDFQRKREFSYTLNEFVGETQSLESFQHSQQDEDGRPTKKPRVETN